MSVRLRGQVHSRRVRLPYALSVINLKDIMIKHIKKFNSKLALTLTTMVSTMWCAYIFAAIALISFPAALAGGVAAIISWIAQTFLQLVLLSVIMVGQDVQSKKAERRAAQDHAMITEELKQIKEMHEELHIFLSINVKSE